jgi:Zn-dependent oligopeptidase
MCLAIVLFAICIKMILQIDLTIVLLNCLIMVEQVKEFERNGVKLSQSKRKEMEKLKSHIDALNLKYLQNLNDFTKFLLLGEDELAGMPFEFLKVS